MKKLFILTALSLFLCFSTEAQSFTTIGKNTITAPYDGADPLMFAGSFPCVACDIELKYPQNWAPRNTTDGKLCAPCEGSLAWLKTDSSGNFTYVFNNSADADYIIRQTANGWFTSVTDTMINVVFSAGKFVQGQQRIWFDAPVTLIFGNGGIVSTTTTTTVTTSVTTTVKRNVSRKKK